MHRGKGQSFKYHRPAIARGVSGELLNGLGDESLFHFGRRRSARLGRFARHVERSHDATDIDCCSQVFQPVGESFVFATLERRAQFFALAIERSVFHEGCVVGSSHHRAQIAQVDSVDDRLDGIYRVTPLSNAQSGQNFKHLVDEWPGVDRRLAFFGEFGVLIFHCSAQRTDTASESHFGEHTLFGLQCVEHRLTVLRLRTQPSSARTLGELRRGRRELTSPRWRTPTCFTGSTATRPLALTRAPRPGTALATATTCALGPAFVAATTAVGRHFGNGLKGDSRSGDFEQGDVSFALFHDRDRYDGCSVHIHFDFGTQNVAHLGTTRQQVGGTHTFGGLRASLAPGE